MHLNTCPYPFSFPLSFIRLSYWFVVFVCLKQGLPCSSGWSQMLHPPASVSWVLASQCSMHCYTLFIRLNPTHQSMQKTWVSCSNHLLSCLFPSLTWCCACLFAAKAKEAMIIVKRRQEASAGFLWAPGSDKTSWASIYPPIWRVRVTSRPHVVICQQGSEDVDNDSISHGFYPLPSSQPLQFSRTDGHEHSPGESPACSSYEFLCIVGNPASFPVISIPLTTSSLSWHLFQELFPPVTSHGCAQQSWVLVLWKQSTCSSFSLPSSLV